MSLDDPGRLVVAKNATPVVVGVSDQGETFVASDIPAFLSYTREAVVLEDGEIAELTANSVSIEMGGETVDRDSYTVTWDPITAEKGGYRTFHAQRNTRAATSCDRYFSRSY